MGKAGSGRHTRLAWTLCAVSLALVAASVTFWILNRSSLRTITADSAYLNNALIGITFPIVGALIVWRRPGNPVGWLFCAAGVTMALTLSVTGYAVYGLKTNPNAPGGELAAWFGNATWVPGLSLMIFILLLFPDGRLPSRRWRWVAWLTALGIALLTLFFAFHPDRFSPDTGVPEIRNPLGIEGAKVALEVAAAIGVALIAFGLFASVVALIQRFRRSHGPEREQLKWFTYAAGVLVVLSVATTNVRSGVLLGVLQAFVIGPGLAVAVGVAILRHRLYEIDVVINRTLVYGALTASLGLAYIGSVLVLQAALSGLTRGSELAVTGSTLAVAALFRPARARIQATVDRRFYRRKYDAARTLETFSARLREEVDLDSLSAELRGVVRDTMQPSHVSLWLRAPGGGR